MGALADLAPDEMPATVSGTGRKLVEWWQQADADDRALLRQWLDTPVGQPGHRSHHQVAELLTAAGFPISQHTVLYGARLLRRLPEWAS